MVKYGTVLHDKSAAKGPAGFLVWLVAVAGVAAAAAAAAAEAATGSATVTAAAATIMAMVTVTTAVMEVVADPWRSWSGSS